MQKKFIPHAHIICRHHVRYAIDDKAHVANEGLVQDAVNSFAIVAAPLGMAAHFRSVCCSKLAHCKSLAPSFSPSKSQFGFYIEPIDASYALTYDAAGEFLYQEMKRPI